MKPEITITVDDMGVTTVEVELMGAHLETLRLSNPVIEALRAHFANEVAA